MIRKPMVLILCTGNSCRSQMAEAFLRKYRGSEFDVASAGTEPAESVHSLAVQVMAEIGIDISEQKPKSLQQFLGKSPVRHVLIVCDHAGRTCPRIWPGCYTRQLIPFDDPAEVVGDGQQRLSIFRRVRDEIAEVMRDWQPAVERLKPSEE